MKNLKRLLALAVAGILAVSTMACGSQGGGSKDGTRIMIWL